MNERTETVLIGLCLALAASMAANVVLVAKLRDARAATTDCLRDWVKP